MTDIPASHVTAEPVNLEDKLATFADHGSPRIVATFNDNDIMIVRVDGEFVWHAHPKTEELFLVLEGELDIDLRNGTVKLGPGELFVVSRGTEHRPAARNGEVKMFLIEPRGTLNTGDELTAAQKVAI